MNTTLNALFPEPTIGLQINDLRILVYAMSGAVCGYLGTSTSLALRTQRQVQQLWLQLCPLYFLAAATAMLHIDTIWLQWVRTIAREQHAYEFRRYLQFAILTSLMLLLVAGWQSLHRVCNTFTLRTLLLLGASGTLALHILRYVSFHYTDVAMNYVLLNYSVAIWIELVSLGLVVVGTGLELLRSQGHV